MNNYRTGYVHSTKFWRKASLPTRNGTDAASATPKVRYNIWQNWLGAANRLDIFSSHVNRPFNEYDPVLETDRPIRY